MWSPGRVVRGDRCKIVRHRTGYKGKEPVMVLIFRETEAWQISGQLLPSQETRPLAIALS